MLAPAYFIITWPCSALRAQSAMEAPRVRSPGGYAAKHGCMTKYYNETKNGVNVCALAIADGVCGCVSVFMCVWVCGYVGVLVNFRKKIRLCVIKIQKNYVLQKQWLKKGKTFKIFISHESSELCNTKYVYAFFLNVYSSSYFRCQNNSIFMYCFWNTVCLSY